VELLSGGQLYDKIRAKHRFSSQEIRAAMRGVLFGLQAMHEQGLMHRDLKPENILYREAGGECVIADFGLAERAAGELMFLRCGTPGYVAP
jgi:serine/threonine protein kinase